MQNDGGIYTILTKLMENVFTCKECNDSFYGRDSIENRSCYVLRQAEFESEFDWFVPIPGLLHLEMNAAKSFLSLNWTIFIEKVVKELGFTSENALKYAKKGADHYKLWQILKIIYLAAADELLLPYLRHVLENNLCASVEDYWKYCQDINNNTYLYYQQMIFTYLHSLMLFRIGVRHNNSEAIILSAESKMKDLIFTRNHPVYREIIYQYF